ncbi:MAG: hypothetical protein M1821_002149 [Bathelium mastoideum]|nr:MAG: hypothetical protein M1821_002149 [Bathelium mastoideum]KAI9685025.1 MAG: hypothetical protein M1822_005417 [Bathelium mastoideum]
MNNEQFRRFVSSAPTKSGDAANQSPKSNIVSLGSRMRSSIPMTPRTVKGSPAIDFARQVADRDAPSQQAKKFRSSVPKGSKLAAGYHDRTKNRLDEDKDDKAKRVKALEEAMKLGQIDQETFEKLRDEIIGGDVNSIHLVKGLDRRLLERVRRGEDVLQTRSSPGALKEPATNPSVDIDDELDKLKDQEIVPIVKQKVIKKGEMAPPPATAGAKRNRDAILAELKASRKAAAQTKEPAAASLGPRFRKIGDRSQEPRIERDEKGREILIVVDEDGNVKRRVRKAKAEGSGNVGMATAFDAPITNTTPIGMEMPVLPLKSVEDEEDDDIFEGVGTKYDPLAGLEDDEDESEAEERQVLSHAAKSSSSSPPVERGVARPEGHTSASRQTDDSSKPRNYFTSVLKNTESEQSVDPMSDPTILTALKKAQNIQLADEELDNGGDEKDKEKEARLRRRAAMLATADRDLEDMDMGFGSSRFGDADEAEEGGKIKLSEWKGVGAEGNDEGAGGGEGNGGNKRKRGPKKKGR